MSPTPNADGSTLTPDPRERRSRTVENITEASILLITLAALGALLFFIILVEQMGMDACSQNIDLCDLGLLGITTWIVPAIVAAFVVLTLIAAVVNRKTGRRSRWVPLLGIPCVIFGFAIASILIRVAIRGATG